MDTPTAADVINDAAVELGTKAADLADPFASTDQSIILLCRLLKRLGRSLVRSRDWSHLTKEHTFATVNGTPSYALPTDYARMKDATHWNRSTLQPLGSPVDGQAWQQMKATTVAGILNVPFRVFGNLLFLYPTPTAAESIYYEYISKLWVMPTGQTVPTTSAPTAATDTLWFDEQLLVTGLKLLYCRAKSLPSDAAQMEYNEAWAAAAGGDGAAPVLSLTGTNDTRLIDTRNLPDTGWGL